MPYLQSNTAVQLALFAQPCKVFYLGSLLHTHLLKGLTYHGSSATLQSQNFTTVCHIVSHQTASTCQLDGLTRPIGHDVKMSSATHYSTLLSAVKHDAIYLGVSPAFL